MSSFKGPLLGLTAATTIILTIGIFVLHNGSQQSIAGFTAQTAFRNINTRQRQGLVVCMIFTTPDKWSTKARAVRLTWATRCPLPIFFYSGSGVKPDHPIRQANDTVSLDVPEGRDSLTQKTWAGLRYSHNKYGDVAEWFMKADDDTYVIWENLEQLLEFQPKNPSLGLYLGRKSTAHLPTGYMSGGAGYLINRYAVKLMLAEGTKKGCPQTGAIEDLDIGRCLAKFGIYPANTTDYSGKLRFHSNSPIGLFHGQKDLTPYYVVNFNGAIYGNDKAKDEMLSRTAVTFHYITPGEMLMFDYLLYQLQRGDEAKAEMLRKN